MTVPALTVAVITNVRLYRDALAQILAANPRLRVFCVNTPHDWEFDWVAEVQPEIVLADAALVCETDVIARVRERQPTVRVIAFGVPESEADVVACARAGAAGLVLRSASGDELLAVIEGVSRNELLCSPRLAAMLFSALRCQPEARGVPIATLTIRESEVLSLIEQGCSNKEIARRLVIEVPTVKNHVHNIFEKLGVSRRAAAIAVAHRQRQAAGSG